MSKKSQQGFTLVEIMIVVCIIALLATIAIPSMINSREAGRIRMCIDNLRQIDDAKQQWALENGKTSADQPVDSDIQPYLGRGVRGVLPWCPADNSKSFTASYKINQIQTPPICNISSTTHILPNGTATP